MASQCLNRIVGVSATTACRKVISIVVRDLINREHFQACVVDDLHFITSQFLGGSANIPTNNCSAVLNQGLRFCCGKGNAEIASCANAALVTIAYQQRCPGTLANDTIQGQSREFLKCLNCGLDTIAEATIKTVRIKTVCIQRVLQNIDILLVGDCSISLQSRATIHSG